MSTLRFDTAQANAYSILQAMNVIPCDRRFIWVPCFTAATQTVPILVSELMLGLDGEESDSEEDRGDDHEDILMQDILADDPGSDDGHFM